MAENCWVAPMGTEAVAGTTEMEATTGGPTVTFVLACTAPIVALSVVWPRLAAVARPALVTLTTPVSDDDQVVDAVTSKVVPSL